MKTLIILYFYILISFGSCLRLRFNIQNSVSQYISTRIKEIVRVVNIDKESNRKFRRTIFNKQDWKNHRSSNRYFRDFRTMPFSLILRGLTVQALVIMAWSFFLVVFNLQAEKMPFGIKLPLLSLPTLPVSLTSPSLGLLLVFRTNTAYSRWKAARKIWAAVSSCSFDLMRQAILWIPDASLKRSLVRYIVAFSKTLKWHLGHQGNDRLLEEDLNDVLASEEMSKLLLSKNRVQHTVMRIAETISRANLVPNAQSHMDKGLCELSDAMYSCDRIYTSPIPLMYTRHTARFLLMWLLTVPMALYYEFRNSNIPYLWLYVPLITFVHSIFLFGIEELGVQIEEPFSILPLANICTNIKNLGVELLQDIGLDISPPKTTNSSIQQTTPSPEMIMSPTSEMGGLNTTQLSNFHVNGEPLSINQTDVATAPPIPTQPSEAHLEIYHNLLI